MPRLAWIALSVLVLIGLALPLISRIRNPGVVRELHENPDGELARRAMLIKLPSGKTIPVNYLRKGDYVYAGADFPWWRELRGEGARVELLVRGERLVGHGRAVEDDPEYRADVFSRLRPTALSFAGTLVEVRIEPPAVP